VIGLQGTLPRLPVADPQTGAVALKVDLSVFAMEAVLRAAYKFTDRCHLFVERPINEGKQAVVTFRPKGEAAAVDMIVGDFANELIDQQLREHLAREAGPIREILVAQAFAEGNLLDPDRDDGDYLRDPKGIGGLRGRGPLASDRGTVRGDGE
jgi:His-Xaa-Ser system protein HxsD